jgi:hypothetical protein
MKSPIYHWDFSLRFIATVAALTLINALLLPWQTSIDLMQEGGLIENATIVDYYIAVAVLWLYTPPQLPRLSRIAISILLLACAARELDLHKAMFGMSILKINFYRYFATGPQIGVALLVISLLLFAVAYLLFQHGRWLQEGIRTRQPTAITVMSMVMLLIFLKILDRSLGIAKELGGYAAPLFLMAIEQSLEEVLEMVLPLLVVIAIVQAWSNHEN